MGIIQSSQTTKFFPSNQRDIVLDIAGNLTQIGNWALSSFAKDQSRIELFLKLTRRNLDALLSSPVSPGFEPSFRKFCAEYKKREEEYRTGIVDRQAWANHMIAWADRLTQNAILV